MYCWAISLRERLYLFEIKKIIIDFSLSMLLVFISLSIQTDLKVVWYLKCGDAHEKFNFLKIHVQYLRHLSKHFETILPNFPLNECTWSLRKVHSLSLSFFFLYVAMRPSCTEFKFLQLNLNQWFNMCLYLSGHSQLLRNVLNPVD